MHYIFAASSRPLFTFVFSALFDAVGRKVGSGVFVSKIVKGGIADYDGKLMQGDQILEVNGQDFKSVSQEYSAAFLKVYMRRDVTCFMYPSTASVHRHIAYMYTRVCLRIAMAVLPAHKYNKQLASFVPKLAIAIIYMYLRPNVSVLSC